MAFVTDNAYFSSGSPDLAGNFWASSDSVASDPHYVSVLIADRIYYNPCDGGAYPQCDLPYSAYPTTATVSSGIVSAINDGRLIVNYIGHSGITEWADEGGFFGLSAPNELASLTNTGMYPVILSMTCFDGYFHYPDPIYSSLAESIVRLPGKGALAAWSASGLGLNSGHDYLDQGFFDAVANLGVRQIGAATLLGKANLFGDPASQLAVELHRLFVPLTVK